MLGQEYIIGKIIGTGSSGDVYLGKNNITKEIVSIKVISKYKSSINEDEVQILARLPISPHSIRLIDTYDEPKKFYIITNYVKGSELSNWQNKQVTLPWLYALTGQMLETLQLIHSMGIVHRDIKLENILVDDDDNSDEMVNFTLIDFGSAAEDKGDGIINSNYAGTYGYYSPQLVQAGVDRSTQHVRSFNPSFDAYVKGDIFALGVVLFLLMEKREPFELNPQGTEPYHQFDKPVPMTPHSLIGRHTQLQRLVEMMLTGMYTSDEMMTQFTTILNTELV